MTRPDPTAVQNAVEGVRDPWFDRPLGSLGLVDDVRTSRTGRVRVRVRTAVPSPRAEDAVARAVRDAVEAVPGVTRSRVHTKPANRVTRSRLADIVHIERAAAPSVEAPLLIGDHTKIVAIGSGKGGVGKSTIAANLAAALAAHGYDVGVLDCDLWGSSIPLQLGVVGRLHSFDDVLLPVLSGGCKVASMELLLRAGEPVLWRGPMLERALQQLFTEIYWGHPDVLLCDLPPGSGDVAMSVARLVPDAELIVVTTPQEAAHQVARRIAGVTDNVGMVLRGVIENMAEFKAPDTGVRYRIFGSGGGQETANALGVPLFTSIPIDPRLSSPPRNGQPLVRVDPLAPASRAVTAAAQALVANVPERLHSDGRIFTGRTREESDAHHSRTPPAYSRSDALRAAWGTR